MQEMLSALARRGCQVTALVPRVKGLDEGMRAGVEVVGFAYAPRRLQTWGHGRSVSGSGAVRTSALFSTPVALSSMAMAARRLIRERSPEVVHLHWVLPQGVLAFATPSSTPVVISAHGADARYLDGPTRPLVKRILRHADALVAASPQVLERIQSVFPGVSDRSSVIPHGADVSLFSSLDRAQARAKLGIPSTTNLVVGVGRFVKKKGFQHLVRAADHMDSPDLAVVLVGDGPMRDDLVRASEQLKNRVVRFTGQLPRAEVAAWLAASDVVALPGVDDDGDTDTGPVVLMEAMAAGRPVVSGCVGMAPDVVVHGQMGLVLQDVSPVGLARALTRALEESEHWGTAAKARFREIGGWDRVARSLAVVYERAIESKKIRIR